jgi:putative CocE/NonD family hydrolase
MTKKRTFVTAAIFVVIAGAVLVWYLRGDPAHESKVRYTKYEFRIPMRDGIQLFTQVYIPRDRTRSYPLLVQRTPFGVSPYGEKEYRPRLGPAPEFDRAGYIFVFQDVRGRFQSQGEFVDMRPHLDHPAPGQTDESTDMADTVDWLLKHVPAHNGRVGIWGMSYPGFYAAASIIDSHPAIKAASVQAPMTNLFLGDDAYHNGAFMLAQQFQIYANYFKPRAAGLELPSARIGHFFDYGTTDGYNFFLTHGPALHPFAALAANPLLDQNIRHNTLDDYWNQRDLSQQLHNIHCPVLTVGGWFDAEDLAGTLRTYNALAGTNPSPPRPLVMGPWGHGDWLRSPGRGLGPLDFGSDTGTFFRGQVLFPFFEYYLKDAPATELPGALVFETGTNQWRRYPSWPPAGTQPTSLYLRANGRLAFEPPSAGENPFDAYVSDPASPVPYVEQPPTELDSSYMYADQSFAARRADVLTYRTEPLDRDLTVAGPLLVRLHVSSSGTDSDFVVKLIDEAPPQGDKPGSQQLVRGETMPVRFRDSFTTPEPLEPNVETPLSYTMPDVNHTFLRGRRIVVQVQSSWFPLTGLNPQTFTPGTAASASDFIKATQHVFHTPAAASSLVLEVLPR